MNELKQEELFQSYQMIDLDEYIHSKHPSFGHLGEYIRSVGFETFRNNERESIIELSKAEDMILSLGGGSLNAKTMSALEGFTGVWLNTPFETCYARIANDPVRPLSSMPKDELRELYTSREDNYKRYFKVTDSRQVLDFIKSIL